MVSESKFAIDPNDLNTQTGTILVVEDDHVTRTLVRRTLLRNRFEVLEAATGEEAMALLETQAINLVVLDIMLPGMDGLEVCRRIRAGRDRTAVIMLTQLCASEDAVRGLLAGADDYMVKPYHPEELVARVQAVLRRTREQPEEASRIEYRNLVIHFQSLKCFKDGRDVELTPKEFALLAALCAALGRTMSREALTRIVWGDHHFMSDKSLDVYVMRLRQKIEDDPAEPTLIRTVRGCGYVCG